MSEKSLTPKTSLREAINNAAGPVALSNRVLLQFGAVSLVLFLLSSPTRIRGTLLDWLAVAFVGYLATLLVFLAFRATLLPAKSGREPKRLLTSIAYFLAGGARGGAIFVSGSLLGIMPQAELWYRLLGGPLFVYGAMSMLAIFNASRLRHEKTLLELESEKADLDELRGGIRERIRLQRADLLKRVQATLAPAVQQVTSDLQNSPSLISLKLREVVETVVRPLSHDIGRGSRLDDEAEIISRRAAVANAKSKFPSRLSAGAMIVPELALFATTSIAIVSNWISFPESPLLASLISLFSVYFTYKVIQKVLINVWVPFIIALLISLSASVASGFTTRLMLQAVGFHLQDTIFYQFIIAQICITSVSFYMQFLRTQRSDAEREMTQVVSDLAILNSQLRQEVWLNRRRIASILHGSVQAALYASAIRLAKIGKPTEAEINSVQVDIATAISKLETTDGAETFVEVLNQIREVWEGAVEVQLPQITPDIAAQMEGNPVASACAAEVVREAVSNAVKHGKAEHIVISVEMSGPNLLGITVSNDGHPLPAEVEAGYGSTILDEVAFSWQLENRGGFTVLGAAIAI